MTTLEQRVAALENRMSGMVTQQELNVTEKALESAMYTMEGRLKGDIEKSIEKSKNEILDAINNHTHP